MTRKLIASALAATALFAATPALADGDIACKSGPKDKWQPVTKLKKAAWMEGWKIIKTEISGDCYEVYAHTESGQVVEAFFHPVTLEKLVVIRRGSEIYRKKGFTG
ncbi:PepSY domain-containing protein [Croceicoccus bisphenolivorans]|uniref:PepSY domain-containing protein n=1 Tax=Croceicoccus bisphenolivorans TaxID=1783232 RepID=UPI00082DBA60|nr:PepSY domain-containing protein [Croceicoccus bisphenolivorans]